MWDKLQILFLTYLTFTMKFQESLKKHYFDIVKLRRQLHQKPELSRQERETTQILEEFLTSKGIAVTRPLPTGLVATIKRGQGPVIAFRADIDALPVKEETNLPFASKNEGIMHACGHDGHAAVLALAMLCFLEDESWQGEVRGIFQPSEEMYGGAKPMIEKGVLDQVELILGLHIWPEIPQGIVGSCVGTIMASNDRFSVKIKGQSAHGATPHLGVDPIVSACNMVNSLQTLISREIAPWEGAVLTIGSIKAGTAYNIIPNEAVIEGTIRTLSPVIREKMEKSLKRLCSYSAKALGTEAIVEYIEQYPPTVNHKEVIELVKAKLPEPLEYKTLDHPSMAAEDFAYYLEEVPGALFFLGSGTKEYHYPLHHSKFQFDEKILSFGAELFYNAGLNYLQKNVCQ